MGKDAYFRVVSKFFPDVLDKCRRLYGGKSHPEKEYSDAFLGKCHLYARGLR
ncbi:MAG: hypothetical protein ACTSXX_00625 [Candidatus Baldrarchaeia archaeon]